MPTLFLCGDVMTGRRIDQILANPCPPGIQEPYVRDARDYVALAEEANGPIPYDPSHRPCAVMP
jgi:poly-gamma-glutamate capsule biosynthesis protein CapA/YwtB (metallophosphatase superfamily)